MERSMTQKTLEDAWNMRYRYDASYASLASRNEEYKEKKDEGIIIQIL